MKKALIVFIAFIIVSSFSSCRTSAGFSGNVPFKEARNYFFNNDASVPASPLITTRQEFDKLFGMAAVMGKDGMPTDIDFSKQNVIAVVLPETSLYTTIKPLCLSEKDGELRFFYKVINGEDMKTYTIRPIYLLIIDKKYVQNKHVVLLERDK